MSTRAQLVEELLKFPAVDRAEAARALLESLDDEDPSDDPASAWADEIGSRLRQMDDGTVTLEEGSAAMRGIRQRARERLERRKP
jgi:hypothetical protein